MSSKVREAYNRALACGADNVFDLEMRFVLDALIAVVREENVILRLHLSNVILRLHTYPRTITYVPQNNRRRIASSLLEAIDAD